MNSLVCLICESPFLSKRSDTKYCSQKCRSRQETIVLREKIRSERVPIFKKCGVCNEDFETSIYTPYQLYCSPVCTNKAMSRRAVESGRKKAQYQKHKAKYAVLKSKTDIAYKDKIRFSSNKKQVLDRDGNKCTECGKEKGLIVHHIDHSSSGEEWNNDMDNLITLCRPCHMRHHHTGENSTGFKHITKEQILDARKESTSWNAVALKLGVERTTLRSRRKQFNIL